jgi:CubicO group peptidase (beta-lactamase class C family)
MNQSLLYDLPYVIPQRAYGYREEAGAVFATDYLFQTYGDGGIFSSMQDMIAWDHALGSNQLVSQAVIERAWQTGLTNAGQTTGYGLGWKVGRLGRYATVWHGGGDPGFASLIQRIPQLELSLILFTNADGRSDWLKDVAQKMIVELLECLSEK